MLIRSAALVLMGCSAAYAQDASLRYAVFPYCPSAMAVSVAAWQAVQCQPQLGPDGTTKTGCDPEQVSQRAYPVVGLTDLTRCAVVIRLGDFYAGEQIGPLPNGKTYRLTAGQIASLATRQGMGTLLGDILSVATVGTRLGLTGKTAAVNAAVNANQQLKTDYATLTSGPIDLQNPLTASVMSRIVAAGALTDVQVSAILAPNPVTPGGT